MEKNFANILSNHTEILIDSLIDNEILKEIPVIGTSINLIKGVKSIRDKIFLNKIQYFLINIGELNPSQKERLIKESTKDNQRRTKFGESLYTTIEQADSLIKIKYLAIVFEAFLNKELNNKELRHICHGINKCFIDDLMELIENEYPDHQILEPNISTGFVTTLHGGFSGDLNSSNISYMISPLGEKIRKAWKEYA